jgi:succinylglutamate desuccinylase
VDVFVNETATSPDGSSLTTDVAVLGAAHADRALLVVSATHGPEGFVGSAAQTALLDAAASRSIPPSVRIVLIHAINPFGFAHLTRTTEHNVDLNRNFIDWEAAPPENPAYLQLHEALCPRFWTTEELTNCDAAREAWILRHGEGAFVDMTSRGQYTHSDGLNFGGHEPEWSHRTLQKIVQRHLSDVAHITLIDWHTALGERGKPFFLCFNERGSPAWERACRWWGHAEVETRAGFGGATRPNYTGLLFHGVERFAPHAELTGAVIEFGTVGMDEARRALQADRYLRFAVDEPSSSLRDKLRFQVLEAFSPPSADWKRSVLGHAMGIQQATLEEMAVCY